MSARHDDLAPALPWSEASEQALLGVLLNDSDALTRLASLKLQPAQLFDHRHRLVLTAIVTMHAAHQPVDVVTAFEWLRDHAQADDVGGLAYMNELAQAAPSARNLERYAEKIIDKAVRRDMVGASQQALELASAPGDTLAALDQIEALYARLRGAQATSAPRSAAELIIERTAHWEALEAGTAEPGIPTGFATLDDAFGGGLKPGKNIVLAARPGVGKSSLAWQVSAAVAARNKPVLVLSQEMQAGDLVDRAVANLGRVSLSRLTTGRFDKDDWTRITEAADTTARMPLYIDDQPALTVLDIRNKARQVQQHCGGLALVVVDYLQLCASASTHDSRHHQIEAISRGMKTLAKEIGCTVLLLSQLTRASELDEPELHHLKESGAIEEDADTVILLHPMGDAPEGGMLVLVKLAKNRQGRRGRLGLAFDGDTQRWQASSGIVSRMARGRA